MWQMWIENKSPEEEQQLNDVRKKRIKQKNDHA